MRKQTTCTLATLVNLVKTSSVFKLLPEKIHEKIWGWRQCYLNFKKKFAADFSKVQSRCSEEQESIRVCEFIVFCRTLREKN